MPETDVELALLRQDMDEMKKAMASLELQVGDLVEAWKTATGLVKFMKWTAGAVAAAAIIWTMAKDHIK